MLNETWDLSCKCSPACNATPQTKNLFIALESLVVFFFSSASFIKQVEEKRTSQRIIVSIRIYVVCARVISARLCRKSDGLHRLGYGPLTYASEDSHNYFEYVSRLFL